MSGINIDPVESSLPPLRLPSGALPASHPDNDYDGDADPPEIEPIEHRLRVDFIAGGPSTSADVTPSAPPLAREYADQTLLETYQDEQQWYGDVPDQETLAHAPAYLQAELRPMHEQIVDIHDGRRRWYLELIPTNLETILSSVESLFPSDSRPPFDVNEYVGGVVIPDEAEPGALSEEYDVALTSLWRESQLDDHTSPSEYGIELPAPLLIGDYVTESRYSLIPWSDGLVCACPYKQSNPWAVMCKHELLATIRLATIEEWLLPVDRGAEIPQRARRFVSPTVASCHTSQSTSR